MGLCYWRRSQSYVYLLFETSLNSELCKLTVHYNSLTLRGFFLKACANKLIKPVYFFPPLIYLSKAISSLWRVKEWIWVKKERRYEIFSSSHCMYQATKTMLAMLANHVDCSKSTQSWKYYVLRPGRFSDCEAFGNYWSFYRHFEKINVLILVWEIPQLVFDEILILRMFKIGIRSINGHKEKVLSKK